MNNNPTIRADYREQPSGIPALLREQGINISMRTLRTGDYIIKDEIAVERKSADDFIQSLISGRLFDQCSRLSKSGLRNLLMIEGNPFRTRHQMDNQAIKGALLSVSVSWQIPVIFSGNKEDSVNQLRMLSNQAIQHSQVLRYKNYKSKRFKAQQIQFLQGLPDTGAIKAGKLFDHFGSIEAVINADTKALQEIEGIGKKSASRLRTFITNHSKGS